MGKWGLGMWDTTGSPLKHGFDLFFGYNCQRHAHSHYPTYLYRNDKRIDLPDNDGEKGKSYTQDLFEKEALAFLDAHKAEPFFLYLPFIVPHVAVQVPKTRSRSTRASSATTRPTTARKATAPTPPPTPPMQRWSRAWTEASAEFWTSFKELKLEGNTLVIFTSDNGPTHNVGGADSTFFKSAGSLRGLKGKPLRRRASACRSRLLAPAASRPIPRLIFLSTSPTCCRRSAN